MQLWKYTAASNTWGYIGSIGTCYTYHNYYIGTIATSGYHDNQNYYYNLGSIGFTNIAKDLAMDTLGVPYFTYSDSTASGKTSVKRFRAGAWEYVGPAGISDNMCPSQDIACDTSGGVVVCYRDTAAAALGAGAYSATAKKYNPSTNTWDLLGTRMFTADADYVGLQYGASDNRFYCLIRESTSRQLSMWQL
jgi:hypothetical protein